jgi:hypothetical protein
MWILSICDAREKYGRKLAAINFIPRILIQRIHLRAARARAHALAKMHRHAILGCAGIHSRGIRASAPYDTAQYRLHRTSSALSRRNRV